MLVAVHKGTVPLDATQVMARELSLIGTPCYGESFATVIETLASGAVDVSAMVSHKFPAEAFIGAFLLAGDPERSSKVLVRYSG